MRGHDGREIGFRRTTAGKAQPIHRLGPSQRRVGVEQPRGRIQRRSLRRLVVLGQGCRYGFMLYEDRFLAAPYRETQRDIPHVQDSDHSFVAGGRVHGTPLRERLHFDGCGREPGVVQRGFTHQHLLLRTGNKQDPPLRRIAGNRAERCEVQRDTIDRVRDAAFGIEHDLRLEFVLGQSGVQQQRPCYHRRIGHAKDCGSARGAGLAAGPADGFANDGGIAYIAPVHGRGRQWLDGEAVNATARSAPGKGDELDRRRADVDAKWRSGSPFMQPHAMLPFLKAANTMRNALRHRRWPPRTWLKRVAGIIVWLAAAGVCGTCLGLASAFLYLDPQIPSTETYTRYSFKTPLRIYTADGALIAEFGDRLIPIKLADVPQHFIDALLNTEDKRFYDHFGIDLISFTNDFINLLTFPDERTGASTITMQLAKVVSFSPKQEFIRKFKEMLLALKVEQELSKEQILELYVNIMSFGKRAYGVQAAAHTYYGKSVDELNLAQLAMLAGIMKKPSGGNPINGPEWALDRRNLVLRRMLQQGSITEAEYRPARAAPITAAQFNPEIDLPAPYPAEWVRQQLEERYGADLYSGFVAYTTLDAKHQAAAQRAVRAGLMNYDRRHGYRGPEGRADPDAPAADSLASYSVVSGLEPAIVVAVEERAIAVRRQDDAIVRIEWDGLRWARPFLGTDALGRLPRVATDVAAVGDVVRIESSEDGWRLRQVPDIQGALVALDPRNGAVRALVGGWSFHTRQFNHALQGSRQPGSGFKPFVYSAALEQGVTPATVFWDAPLVFEDANLETTYRPRNDSGDYRGPMPLRQALYQSRNAVSIRVMRRVGAAPIIDHASRFGFDTGIMPRNTQLAIGGGTMTLAPIDMAAGYAAFANGGFRIEPHIIKRVERLDGQVVLEPRHAHACDPCPASETNAPAPESAPRAISERNAFIMDSMLRDVIRRGTGRRARALDRADIAGKTGTTDLARDTWFNGYHPNLVATTWVGFSDRRPAGEREYGSTTALPIWIDFMREALADEAEVTRPIPEGVVSVKVVPGSGQTPAPGDPNAIFEYFFADKAPRHARRGNTPTVRNGPRVVRPEELF